MRWAGGKRRINQSTTSAVEKPNSVLRIASDRPSARYGIEIRGTNAHVEAGTLSEVLESLARGTAALQKIYVIDRWHKKIVFEGAPGEVQRAVRVALTLEQFDRKESIDDRDSQKRRIVRHPGLYAS